MSQDMIKGEWQQLKGKVRQWWGDLSEDDVARIDGSIDKLVGALRERYGYEKDRALAEVNRRIEEFRNKSHKEHVDR
ncbi:MAG TPA: CsbD family protein [Polyangiaceae bacterium]|jgi:uncharacterized protein YjbJ (UPF0337 family)